MNFEKHFMFPCWLLVSLILFPFIFSLSSFDNKPFWDSKTVYPPCPLYADTVGKWIRTSQINSTEERVEINRHFSLQEPGNALIFSEVWIPNDCSYHRFTNETVFRMVRQVMRKTRRKQVHIGFIGDSATRGIFCGLSRILSGSEIFGPCDNVVCGGSSGLPVTYKTANHLFDVDFGKHLKFTFAYIYGIEPNAVNLMETFLSISKPFVMLLNTGAWDFDNLARDHKHDEKSPSCDTDAAVEVSQKRASVESLKAFHDLSVSAKNTNTRLIYRNNHYNKRFGAECADLLLETKLLALQSDASSVNWEIWDNRRISKDVYVEQCWDGFHFDRHRVHSYDHHANHMEYFYSRKWDLPGELEIQLAQSFLNAVFHEEILEEYQRLKENPDLDLQQEEEALREKEHSKFKISG
jgi:hypothetical protein